MIIKGYVHLDAETDMFEISIESVALDTYCAKDEDPLEYAKDALICGCEDLSPRLEWEEQGKSFLVHENNVVALVAFMLHQNRVDAGLTQSPVANNLGSDNANAFATYEQGKGDPSLSKLDTLAKSLGLEVQISFRQAG